MTNFQVGSMFSVLLASLISSIYTDGNSRLARLTKKHSQLFLFPNRVPIEVLPEGYRTYSFRQERLGLPYWTMIEAICVVVHVSKMAGHSDLEFSIILEHLPF